MPRGDYRKRETKKLKKDVKKAVAVSTVLSPTATPTVEVIKTKGKKETEEEET